MREPGFAPSITRATESIMGTFAAGGSVYSNAAYLPRVSLTPDTRKMVSLLKSLTEGKQGQGDNIRPMGQAAAIIARVRGLNPLNDNRWCHAAAGAHSDQAGIQVSSLQLIQYGAD